MTFNLLNVVKNYLVIKECGLDLSQCSSCKREQNFVRFFAGTPNEQVVDTGRCGGQCSQQGEGRRGIYVRKGGFMNLERGDRTQWVKDAYQTCSTCAHLGDNAFPPCSPCMGIHAIHMHAVSKKRGLHALVVYLYCIQWH